MVFQRLRDRLESWRAQTYIPVAETENDYKRHNFHSHSKSIYVYIATSLGILLLVASLANLHLWSRTPKKASVLCKNPPVRREWRALDETERTEFFEAVNCLTKVPSRWGLNGTHYDDFALLHGRIGSWCHRSASFFPWHRNTLAIWERALKDNCGYTNQIPYWDWSLDWMDLANSSIWDSTTGFGGDGDPKGPVTVGKGRCVIDGPFSHFKPIIYNHTFGQHCLSRGFRDGETLGRLPGNRYSPESIGRMLRKSTYEEFVRDVESYLHNTMHQSVAGDFLAMTAANDPLFYLHHVQIDRLWWRWQQENPGHRLKEYHGKHMFNSTGEASTDDPLMYAGFSEDIAVSKVMNTEGGYLCYRY